MRFRAVLFVCVGLWITLAGIVLAGVPFAPKGVTHSNLFGVYEQTSPTTTPTDRPIIEFKTSTGLLCVLTWQGSSGNFLAINAATGATCATIPTTTTAAPTTTTTAAPTTTTTAAPTTTTT